MLTEPHPGAQSSTQQRLQPSALGKSALTEVLGRGVDEVPDQVDGRRQETSLLLGGGGGHHEPPRRCGRLSGRLVLVPKEGVALQGPGQRGRRLPVRRLAARAGPQRVRPWRQGAGEPGDRPGAFHAFYGHQGLVPVGVGCLGVGWVGVTAGMLVLGEGRIRMHHRMGSTSCRHAPPHW